MNHALGVGMLHRAAHLQEQLQPLGDRQLVQIAERADRLALAQLHHKVRPPAGRRAGLKDLGDVGVVHHRQRLAFLFEPRHHLARVHARLDHLQRNATLDRLTLLGRPHPPEAALADQLQQPEPADLIARLLIWHSSRKRRMPDERLITTHLLAQPPVDRVQLPGQRLKHALISPRAEQVAHLLLQLRVIAAARHQKRIHPRRRQ